MVNKTIVVLANSYKHSQHCVAGKCIRTGNWVRPVSNPSGAELSHAQVRYQNPHGTYNNVRPLQKVEIYLSQHVPLENQPENYLVGDGVWQQRYRITEDELQNFLDHPYDLWGEGSSVPFQFIQNGEVEIEQSLYLVEVDNLNLFKNQYEKRRASFEYNGIGYELAVTDPNFDSILASGQETNGILCISLGENFEGSCYKIVATIF
ncbi:hypothetical protein NX722_02905 [Endozoicomonas gorgoniicola]|uniref:Dual OB-containing domain-containing protein n=1 Tax=Endozoicomonas gorgoniicola TaxID=1234144 RepID=A0ABT3MRD0_9GAMM|nr:hypothetical protein [Endozoicomonas gorgoniicola]MCW7551609.1 hypothetical protein [Endozoicomonas gorgoniicola]